MRETFNAEAVSARTHAGTGDAALALTGGRLASSDAPSISDTTAATSDASRFGRIAAALGVLCDPLVILGMAQAVVKDTQVTQQEDAIELESDRASQAAKEQREAIEKALKSAEEAKGWGVFAQVATRVAAVVAAVAGFVSGAFTGGLGAVAAVGLLVVAFGSDLTLVLQEADVDKEVTNAIGLGAAIVGTVCSLGAGIGSLAGLGTQVGATVAQQTANAVMSVAQAAAEIGAGTAGVVASSYRWDSDHRHLDAEAARATGRDATDMIDEHVEDVRAFMTSYQRVVERLARTAEANDAAMQAASQRLA